jgi:hypothetical protein
MFTRALLTTATRARHLWLAALVCLFATGIAAASAQASPSPAGDAVIASAGGTTIDTTSGSVASVGTPSGRSSSAAGGNALTINSTAPTTATPAHTESASRQVDEANIESPIVGLPTKSQNDASRAALAQIQSAGPIVAYSGTISAAKPATRHKVTAAARESFPTPRRAYAPRTSSSTIEITAHGVNIYLPISPTTTTRRPSPAGNRVPAHATASLGEVGAPTGFAGLVPTHPRPAPAPGGSSNTTLYGSGSGSSGGTALLGVDSLLAIAVLLVGATWRRRSWDLPVLPRQSALLSLALDRPG